MCHIRWMLPAFLGLLSAMPSHASGCSMALVSKLPLQPYGSQFLVRATMNGKPAQLMFDTGSYTSILTVAAANRLGLHLMTSEEFRSSQTLVSGIGGGRSALGVTAHTIELGGLHARDYNFLEADFLQPPVDGLLSIDLISQFDIDLDLPEHQVMLYKPAGDCSAPAAFLASPLYTVPLLPTGEDRRPRIPVQIGERTLVALVDTGASGSAIFRRAAASLGVRIADLSGAPHGTTGGVGSRRVTSVEHVFASMSVGDLAFENVRMRVLDESTGSDGVDMLLGADFQQKVHVWISYSSHSLIMQFPPLASKRVP